MKLEYLILKALVDTVNHIRGLGQELNKVGAAGWCLYGKLLRKKYLNK
jgi:hypothetical protein